MVTRIMFVLAIAHGVAVAGPVKGDRAVALAQALRFGDVKAKTTKGVRTFQTKKIVCIRSLGRDAVLGDHRCTIDRGKEITGAAAYVVYAAIQDNAIAQLDATDRITTTATGLSCVIDPARTGHDRVQCTTDKPDPVKITPKKVPVKDIVQPVKIEKR